MTRRKRPLTVCMLCFFFFPRFTGAGNQALNLARQLRKDGVDVFFITSRNAFLPRRDRVDGFPVWRLPIFERHLKVSAPLYWLGTFLVLLLHLRTVDVVHVHSAAIDGLGAGLFARLFRRFSVVKATMPPDESCEQGKGLHDLSSEGKGLVGRLHFWYLRMVHYYVAASSQAFEGWKRYGFEISRILPFPNGVDTDRFAPAGEDEKLELKKKLGFEQSRVAVYTGSILALKGVDLLIEAWGEVVRAIPEAHLVLVGPWERQDTIRDFDNTFFPNLLKRIESLGIGSNVTFVGRQENVEQYLKIGDIFTFTTRQDLLPNSLLEGLGTGLPAVTFRVGCTKELIDDGRNGFMVKLDDPSAFADACVRLFSDDDLRRSLAGEARRRILNRFSIRQTARNYIGVYRGTWTGVDSFSPPGREES